MIYLLFPIGGIFALIFCFIALRLPTITPEYKKQIIERAKETKRYTNEEMGRIEARGVARRLLRHDINKGA